MNASSSIRVTSTNVSSSFLVDALMISGDAFVSFIVHTSGSVDDPSWFCVPGRGKTMKLCWRWAFSGTERQNMASTSSPRTVYSTALVAWFSKRICRILGLAASWTNCSFNFLRSGDVKLTSLHSKSTAGEPKISWLPFSVARDRSGTWDDCSSLRFFPVGSADSAWLDCGSERMKMEISLRSSGMPF
jgi:hypothetical protein